MRVLNIFPPNYAAINKAFNVRGKPVLFAYGDCIYNPSRIKIPAHLMVHEAVHLNRQKDPQSWWERYIADPQFRLEEEIPAHRAEVEAFPDLLDDVAARLSSPLYGSLIGYAEARQIIGA